MNHFKPLPPITYKGRTYTVTYQQTEEVSPLSFVIWYYKDGQGENQVSTQIQPKQDADGWEECLDPVGPIALDQELVDLIGEGIERAEE